MASELRVNTLKDAAGANSVAMEYVANGSAKAWVNFNGTGTIAARDSLNVSGLVDNNIGDFTLSYTSSLSNANYGTFATSTIDTSSGSGNVSSGVRSTAGHSSGVNSVLAGSVRVAVQKSNNSEQDCDVNSVSVLGDLA